MSCALPRCPQPLPHRSSSFHHLPRCHPPVSRDNTVSRETAGSSLKPVLVQCAWAAANKKNSDFEAQFLRLKGRRGPKKAAVAVAASILTTVYHMLRDGTCYQDLGPDYFARRNPARTARKLADRIRSLGYIVEIRSAA